MEELFWVDEARSRGVTYDYFINKLNRAERTCKFIRFEDPYQVFFHLILNALNKLDSVLLDFDFSEKELINIGIKPEDTQTQIPLTKLNIANFDELLELIEKSTAKWKLEIYTSGTTGRPKSIKQPYSNLTRGVKKRNTITKQTWAFAYSSSHFAGLQVFFQAFLNQDKIIYVFETPPESISDALKKHGVTHISCTPTFLKQFMSYIKTPIDLLERATFGGERFDEKMLNKIYQVFPNAKIRNVYASTEGGSLFASEGNIFKISNRLKGLVRIGTNRELQIHKSLIGQSETLELEDNWYNTGDLIELIDDGKFKFVSRTTDMINVGGYKVNPSEVEDAIRCVDGVKDVMVSGRENSVTGNIIVANVILNQQADKSQVKLNIKTFAKQNLQGWKIPRIIKFVNGFERTRTGKLKRI